MPESYAPGPLWNMFKCSCLEIQPNIILLPYAIISRKRKTKIIWRTKCGTVKGHDDGTYREAKNINKRSSLHLHFAIIYSFGGSEVSHNFVVYFIFGCIMMIIEIFYSKINGRNIPEGYLSSYSLWSIQINVQFNHLCAVHQINFFT